MQLGAAILFQWARIETLEIVYLPDNQKEYAGIDKDRIDQQAGYRRSEHDLCSISVPKAAAADPRPRDGVLVAMRDSGPGLPPESVDRLF